MKVQEAKVICDGCEVLIECRRHAEANPPSYGVWGGRLYQPNRKQPDKEEDG